MVQAALRNKAPTETTAPSQQMAVVSSTARQQWCPLQSVRLLWALLELVASDACLAHAVVWGKRSLLFTNCAVPVQGAVWSGPKNQTRTFCAGTAKRHNY